jgi:colanic acid/amylovoran biosynthesis glycosyltransferase
MVWPLLSCTSVIVAPEEKRLLPKPLLRIAFVVDTFPSISETFILHQIVAAKTRGHRVTIFASRPYHGGPFHEDVCRHNLLEHTVYDMIPSAFPSKAAGALGRYRGRVKQKLANGFHGLRKHGASYFLRLASKYRSASGNATVGEFDVVHCQYGPNGLAAIRLRSSGHLSGPIITTFHGYDVNCVPRVFGRKFYDELFKKGDCFTVGSESMKARIVALGACPDRISKIPMGVSPVRIPFSDRSSRQVNCLNVLCVARLVEVKGVEYLIRACQLLLKRGVCFSLRVVGEGPLRGSLEGLTASLGLSKHIMFVGSLTHERLPKFWQQADVFVLPSIIDKDGAEENQPVSLAEAQAAGLAVIGTDIGGIGESMAHGRTGLIVPPRNPNALADAIEWMMNHPQDRLAMGQAGRRHIEANYNLDVLDDELVRLYVTVAKVYRAKISALT